MTMVRDVKVRKKDVSKFIGERPEKCIAIITFNEKTQGNMNKVNPFVLTTTQIR